MQKADLLIRTKIHLPFTRAGLVSRPRLQQQVMQGLCSPLTLVVAPAGFGKTTLLTSCISGSGMPVAWLSLDKNDNQPGRFLTYLVAALQTVNPRIGAEASQLLSGIQQARAEAVLTSLINDLDSDHLEMALALDDYHLISSPAVHEELTFLLDHQPNGFHLVIATRSDPPLPLSRMRARGQMVELRTADLRFTEQEAAQFLNDVMGLHLDSKSVAMLDARTEGWIAGLQMAALSMKDRNDVEGFIEGFSGTNRYILDYLLEEVLSRQPPEIQHFLLHTSILERLSAPLCDFLLAESPPLRPSADLLYTLERENLFLSALDDHSSGSANAAWFRYHHLFGDLLRARLHQSQPDLLPRLHLRASDWFEQNQLIAEAIQHLVAAQEIGRAADRIERYGPAYWSENGPSIIQMAESLPHEMLLARSRLGLYLAWLLICQAHIEKAFPLLIELNQQLAAEPGAALPWVQTVIHCAMAFLRPPGVLPSYAALDEIPEDEPILRDAAEVLYGMALARRGDLDGAVEVALRSIAMEAQQVKPGEDWTVPSAVPFLGRIYLIQGRLQKAEDLCQKYASPIKEKGTRFINSPGSMDIVLGEVQYERNHLEESEKLIQEGLRANQPWRNIMTDGFGTMALVRVLLAKGDFAGAAQSIQELENRMQKIARPREFEEELSTIRVRIQFAAGDFQSAFQWADEIRQSEAFETHPEYYRIPLARIFLEQHRYPEVEELLVPEPYLSTSRNQMSRKIEAGLLRAAAAAGQNRTADAFRRVESCLALAKSEGYIQAFLNVGEPARNLLAAYLRSETPAHRLCAQKVLDAFAPFRPVSWAVHASAALVEPLSGREMEVLGLMAEGKTNQEIAQQLIVSRGTIKAHAASIYRKLDVNNRTEAVAHARELGLLP